MSQGTFYITVEDGTMLEVKLNKAHKTTIGVVHIFHGMAEHMDRYDNLVHAFNLRRDSSQSSRTWKGNND